MLLKTFDYLTELKNCYPLVYIFQMSIEQSYKTQWLVCTLEACTLIELKDLVYSVCKSSKEIEIIWRIEIRNRFCRSCVFWGVDSFHCTFLDFQIRLWSLVLAFQRSLKSNVKCLQKTEKYEISRKKNGSHQALIN